MRPRHPRSFWKRLHECNLRVRLAAGIVLLSAWVVPAGAQGRVAVRVGVYDNPPKIFMQDGRISGIFGDLVQNIASGEGWKIVPVRCTWEQCLQMVRSGEIDLMPDVAFSAGRAQTMEFTKVPALFSWSELYRNSSVNISTITDLAGKRLAVLAGSVQESYLKSMIGNFGIRDVRIVPVGSLKEGFDLASDHQVDAVAANNFFGDAAAASAHLFGTPVIFDPAQLFFVTPKGQGAALRDRIDADLTRWEADPNSIYYQILARWRVSTPKFHIPPSVWWGGGVLTLLLIGAVIAAAWQQRRLLEKKRDLEISEDKQALILDHVDALVFIKGLDLRYQYVNKRVTELFGQTAEQIVGLRDDDLFEAETAQRMRTVDERVLREGRRVMIEERNVNKGDDVVRTYLSVKQPLRDKDGHIYALCGISTDFTDLNRSEERIRQLAFYDPLTRLPNRALLLDRIQHAFDNYASTRTDGALLFIDLDNFKVLNDTLGHAKGDILLQQVAGRLQGLVRQSDTLARLGGDEFVLLAEDLGHNREAVERAAKEVADKVWRGLAAEPYVLDDLSYTITASIGVATLSPVAKAEGAAPADELLKRADLAMYEAKAAGRNQAKCFEPRMQSALNERAALETQIREALRLQQFHLVYQPIVDESGRVVAAEALARWTHPEKGSIPPGVFIPCAESSGLILELGDWVLRTACTQLAAWRGDSAYGDLTLSVNISALQIHQPDFVAKTARSIRETGADPHRLQLELTESLLAYDIDALTEKMRALQDIGVRFALDDFGTGYSSLSYLKRLPLDQLKIDQAFVRELLVAPNDAAIIGAVVTLGTSLGLSVVAEGVETVTQHDALLHLGCRRFQGYLFGRPGSADALLGYAASPTS